MLTNKPFGDRLYQYLAEMVDKELQKQIDIELSRYEELSIGIEQLEKDIARQLRSYEEILNSYLNAVQIIQPKMESWRAPRRDKVSKICARLRQKWADVKGAVRSDPSLEQDEQMFQAVLKIHYKKPNEQQAFQKKRQSLILGEVEKLVLPGHESHCNLLKI